MCPFCLLNFSVFSKMEELDKDSLFVFHMSILIERVKYNKKMNSAHAVSSTEKKFWSLVDKEMIWMLEEPWAYLTDLQMFDYSLKDYLDSLGLENILWWD